MRDYRHVFDLKFLELILDVIGVVSYLDFRCIKMIIKSVT